MDELGILKFSARISSLKGLHTRTADARLHLRQLGFVVHYNEEMKNVKACLSKQRPKEGAVTVQVSASGGSSRQFS